MVDSYHADNKRRSEHPSNIAQHPHQVGNERRIGMKRVFCLLVLVSLVALGSFTPALAQGEPLHLGPFHFEGTEVLADCGTFQVLDHYVADLTVTQFLDDQGIRVRDVRQFSGTDTYINSATGKSITERFHNTLLVEYEAGIRTQIVNSGVGYRLTVPGGGAVFLDVGRVVYDGQFNVVFWEAGPHHFLDGDFAGLCAAMA
jgi:hypothetical protein